jgi:peptide/nickel transport system ATP-binding protein
MRVSAIVREPLEALSMTGDHRAMVSEMLTRVGLPEDSAERYPHEFSGGQRQRIALARALIHRPRVLVGDEPVSALDVLVRASLLTLLDELRTELGLTVVTVTHDLGIIEHIADNVAVMHRGAIVESGSVENVLGNPQNDYTRVLLQSVPRLP